MNFPDALQPHAATRFAAVPAVALSAAAGVNRDAMHAARTSELRIARSTVFGSDAAGDSEGDGRWAGGPFRRRASPETETPAQPTEEGLGQAEPGRVRTRRQAFASDGQAIHRLDYRA